MAPKTRQQRRAKSRAPLQRKRRGSTVFLLFLLVLVLGGGALIAAFRLNRPPLTRGAIVGEHWHASLKVFICGEQLTNFPNIEGEVHTHGDAFIHVHPSTPAASGDGASLGTFFRSYETMIAEGPDGKRTLTFPDGTSYTDGDRCPKGDERYDLEVTNKGKAVEGDPGAFLPHDGDAVVVKFGPEGDTPRVNPYTKAKGLPDAGFGADAPVDDTGGEPPEPEDGEAPGPDVTPAPTGE